MIITPEKIKTLWLQDLKSKKIQLDNLDWVFLTFNKQGIVVVENEHGTQFPISDLSKQEIELFYNNL